MRLSPAPSIPNSIPNCSPAQAEFAALTGVGQTLIILHKGDNGFGLLDVPLIARVEVHEPTASSS